MRKISILVLILVLLALFASAKPESVISGPYLVSFDIGNFDHSTTIPASEERETASGHPYTRYLVEIVGTNEKAGIVIDEDVGQMKNLSVEDEVKHTLDAIPGCGKPYTTTRIIDGKPGVVGNVI